MIYDEELGKRTRSTIDQCKKAWKDTPWATYRVIVEVFSPEVGRVDARYVDIADDEDE